MTGTVPFVDHESAAVDRPADRTGKAPDKLRRHSGNKLPQKGHLVRRILLSLLGVFAITLALTGTPAHAATTVTYVTSAYNTGSSPVLNVFLTGDTDLKTLKAHLVPTRNPTNPAIDVPDFTWT